MMGKGRAYGLACPVICGAGPAVLLKSGGSHVAVSRGDDGGCEGVSGAEGEGGEEEDDEGEDVHFGLWGLRTCFVFV